MNKTSVFLPSALLKTILFASAFVAMPAAVYAQEALIQSEAMDDSQFANELFATKLKAGCKITAGQELNVSITNPTLGEAGVYLLNMTCGTRNAQYLHIVQPHKDTLNEVIYASLGDSKSENLSYQQSTRRLFSSAGGKMREIEWQVAAKKKVKKGEEKSELNKALFGKTVPKGKMPEAN